MLKSRTIAAQNTELVVLDSETALSFLALHSPNSAAAPGKLLRARGLTHQDELLAVALFCNPRTPDTQKEYTTELFRIAFKQSVTILGGAARLISSFLKSGAADLFAYQDAVEDSAAYRAAGMLLKEDARIAKRVYEWHNPDLQYYTYKITSGQSKGYYYGRHKTSLQTVQQMLQDGYMGSGGKKYRNWIQSVGASMLRKEIVGVYATWSESVRAEELLIGDLHRTDSNCKNSKPGGIGNAGFFSLHEQRLCLSHGLTPHLGNSCKKCSFSQVVSERNCLIHGATTFYGDHCHKCSILSSLRMRTCLIHGETLHQGYSCKKCTAQKAFSSRECLIHGDSVFQADSCLQCRAEAVRSLRECLIHGETLHMGDSCSKCAAQQAYSLRSCEVHGEVLHQGLTCKSCVANASISLKHCITHGEVKHIGDRCRKCVSESTLSLKRCEVHGETLHQSDACATCVAQKSISVQYCKLHGEVKFLRGKCATCAAVSIVSVAVCLIHGESKHVGNQCKKCMAAKVWTMEECSTHGESKHRSGKCVKCAVQQRKQAKT